MLYLGGNSDLGTNPQRELVFTLLSSALGLGALVILALRMDIAPTLGQVLLLAVVLRVIAAMAWPLLEDDYFRYLWDGRQTALFLSPWQHPPEFFFSQAQLPQQWQWILNNINYPELPSIYGPVLQYVFALAYYIAPGNLTALQGLLVLTDVCILLSLYAMGVSCRWLTAYAIHPLLLKEAIASAHPDLMVALALIWCLYGWQQRRPLLTGVALGIALGAKISALVVLPFVLVQVQALRNYPVHFGWFMKVLLYCGITLALLYAPLLQLSGSEWYSLQTFAREWRFNPLLFRLIEAVAPAGYARETSALVLLVGLAVLWIRWRSRVNNHYPPVDLALLCLLLVSPVVNSWYWLWLLPITVLMGRAWLFYFCAFAVLSYGHGGNISPAEGLLQFHVSPWIALAQGGTLLLCFLLQQRYHKKTVFSDLQCNKTQSAQSIS